jgi:hypothetical protein
LATVRLSGVVRDDNDAGVAGATVAVSDVTRTTTRATTDGSGFFETRTAIDTFYAVPIVEVTISKGGYEDTQNVAAFNKLQDTVQNYRLFKAVTISPGTDAHLVVATDASLCGLESEYGCRHVTIVASTTGVMTRDVVPEDPANQFCFGPVMYPLHCVAHVVQQFTPGTVIPVEIVAVAQAGSAPAPSRGVTLRTSIGP